MATVAGRVTTMRSAWTGAALAVALMAGTVPSPAAAAVLWSLTASPLVVTTSVATTFTLVAQNEDPLAAPLSSSRIGCVVVDVPTNFVVASAGVSASTTGNTWTASVSGNRVSVSTTSGGDRLALLDGIRFTVRATAMSAGSFAWGANAYRDQNCRGSGSLLGVPPIVLVTGPAATPTPSPTSVPTPSPTPPPPPTATPKPTPKPTPRPTASSPSSPTPNPTTRPTENSSAMPGAVASPGEGPAEPRSPSPSSATDSSETPVPSPTESVSEEPRGTTGQAGAQPSAQSGGATVISQGPRPGLAPPLGTAPAHTDPVRLTLGPLGLLGGIDVWAIPGLVVGVPGLLVILFVLLQAAGALAWIPAIRRLRGEEQAATAG